MFCESRYYSWKYSILIYICQFPITEFTYFLTLRLLFLITLGLILLTYTLQREKISFRKAYHYSLSALSSNQIYLSLKSSLKYISLGASSLVIWSIDPIIIRSALSNQDVGTYSLIFRFITLGFFLPTAICTAITPNLSKFSANNSHHELTSLYQSTFHTLLIIFLLFAFPVIFFF